MYQAYIYKLVFSVVKNHADAEDVTQETFVKIYRALPQYEFKGFKTWISRIAMNKAIDHLRKSERIQLRENALTDPNQLTASDLERQYLDLDPTTEQQVVMKETRQLVHAQLQEVPDNYREVVEAYYFENKTYVEIADEQGVATKTVESKLYRAKQWMRKRWKEEDFE